MDEPDTGDDVSFEERLARLWDSSRVRLLEAGMAEEDVPAALNEVLDKTLRESAERVTSNLFERAPSMLEDYALIDADMRGQVREIWGEALDIYRMMWVSAHELGARFSTLHQAQDEPMDPMANAMVGLQARTVRVAAEVFVLLENGMGLGALARARTAHEIAVVAYVLSNNYKTPAHVDIAQRFLDHHAVTNFKDSEQYQVVAERIGYEPFSGEEMAALKQRRDTTVAKYGDAFGRPHGWAAGIAGPYAPNFRQLEELAGLQHMRAHYGWSSHEVHADAKSWALNTREWQGRRFRDTGPGLDGLCDPADMTLIALHQVTSAMVTSVGENPGSQDVLATMVMARLLDRAEDAFLAAHRQVETMRLQLGTPKS